MASSRGSSLRRISLLSLLFVYFPIITTYSYSAFGVNAKPIDLPSTSSQLSKRTARTTAPAGALVVSKSPASGQYSTVQAAVDALPDDGSTQVIFIETGVCAYVIVLFFFLLFLNFLGWFFVHVLQCCGSCVLRASEKLLFTYN